MLPSNLHFGSPDSATRPVNMGDNFPTKIAVKIGDEVKEFPVSYFEKRVLKVGTYIHPGTKEKFTITPAFLDEQARKTNQMIEAGLEVPTPLDHKDEHQARPKNPYFVKAADNIGFVVKATREGDHLKFIQAAIGEDAALTAVRNRSSVYIKPFKDCNGRDWGTCIVHSAYTPIPVMHGMGAPLPLSREDPVLLELTRDQETVMTLSEAQKKRLREIAILNGKTKEQADALDDAALQGEGIAYVEKLPEDFELGKYDQLKKDAADLKTTKEQLTQSQSRESELKTKLAKEEPDAPTAREIKFGKQSAMDRVDSKVASKAFAPAVGEFIKKKIDAEPIKLALSRDDDQPEDYEVLIEVAELAAKTPAAPGREADLRTKKLAREEPPKEDENDDNKSEQDKRVNTAKSAGEKFKKSRQYGVPGKKSE